jgi:hypothetical protein
MSSTVPNTTGTIPNPLFAQVAGATPSSSSGAGIPGEATVAPPGNLTPAETVLEDPPFYVKVLLGVIAAGLLLVGAWALIGPDVEQGAAVAAKAAA